MRSLAVFMCFAGFAGAQALTEHAAAAAGGSVGGAAGKKVSDGITAILKKVDKVAGKAADIDKGGKNGPAIVVGPAAVKGLESVPPPPEPNAKRAGVRTAESKPVPPPPAVDAAAPAVAPPAPPPPPVATVEDLKKIENG